MSGEALEQTKIEAMRLAVDDQLGAGITVISDGEQTRQHFVTTFIDHLDGVDFINRKTVRIREKLAWAFAEILNDEAQELAAAGVDIVQFGEPAFNVFFDEVRDWGVKTLERAATGLPCKTAVHICYGYGIEANIKWKQGLGAEWRQYEQTFPLLRESRCA